MPEIERKKASFFRDCSDKAVENAVTEIQGERDNVSDTWENYRVLGFSLAFFSSVWGFFPFA